MYRRAGHVLSSRASSMCQSGSNSFMEACGKWPNWLGVAAIRIGISFSTTTEKSISSRKYTFLINSLAMDIALLNVPAASPHIS
jgi:hypothetical protein